MPYGTYPTRPLQPTSEQKEAILKGLAKGEAFEKLAESIGIDSAALWNYRNRDPSFEEDIRLARVRGADALADKLLTVTDDCETIVDTQVARIKSDNLKFLARVRNPAVYGERIDVNVNHTIDLSKVLAAADARVIPILEAKQSLINVTPSDVQEANYAIPASTTPIPKGQPHTFDAPNRILERPIVKESLDLGALEASAADSESFESLL